MAEHSLSSDIKHANSKMAEMLKKQEDRAADMGFGGRIKENVAEHEEVERSQGKKGKKPNLAGLTASKIKLSRWKAGVNFAAQAR